MANLLEQAIDCDDADRAARIIQNALGIEFSDVADYVFPKKWPPIVSNAPALSANGSGPKPVSWFHRPSFLNDQCASPLPRTLGIEEHKRSCFIVRDNNGRAWLTCISGPSPEGGGPPICSHAMRRAGSPSMSPSCRTC